MTKEEKYIIDSTQQSRIFAAEMFPHIYRLVMNWVLSQVNILDVGAASGAGTALLQDLFHPQGFVPVKVRMTAMDITPQSDYSRNMFPGIRYITGNLLDIEAQSYDMVFSSHTIEHVEEPYRFLEQLRRISRGPVLITCPYNEVNRIPGHLHTFDRTMVRFLNPRESWIYWSAGWGGDCLVMVF